MMGIRAALLGALLGLAACTGVFAPPYDPAVSDHAATAYGAAARLAAEIQLGQLSDPSSYAQTAPQYVSIMADIAIAKQRAASLPATTPVAKDAQQRLGQLLQGCADNAQLLAGIQQKSGIKPNVGADAALMVSCDLAAKAAAALKP